MNHSPSAKTRRTVQEPPRLPQLSLAVAVVGKRDFAVEHVAAVEAHLELVLRTIDSCLEAIHAKVLADDGELGVRFDGGVAPRLTLVTGLADGVDQIASDVFLSLNGMTAARVLGAVLPCGKDDYLKNSAVKDTARFKRLADQCSFLIELDGAMRPQFAKDDDSSGASQTRRDRADAFEAQATFLLRQADILIAVDAPSQPGRAGGTKSTIDEAIALQRPVALIVLGSSGFRILHDQEDLRHPTILSIDEASLELTKVVDDLIGLERPIGNEGYSLALLKEFFAADLNLRSYRGRIWNAFEARFSMYSGAPSPPALTLYAAYRARASALSAFYAGQYRGSFLLGYGLAVIAVASALVSLILLMSMPGRGPGQAVWWAMVALAVFKLLVVIAIARLVDNSNHKRMAHRAADYRYLSERLRAMAFLPRAGSLRPPGPWSELHLAHGDRRRGMDRLFTSIVRQADPIDALSEPRASKRIRQSAYDALAVIQKEWITGQACYHLRNRQTLGSMSRWLEHLGRRLNQAVIGVVAIDIAVLILVHLTRLPPGVREVLHGGLAPILISLAAVLPAAVASLNGVRFQSECARLAERSEHMTAKLNQMGTRAANIERDTLRLVDALRLAESIAQLALSEVAEWSAIYGKEIAEM